MQERSNDPVKRILLSHTKSPPSVSLANIIKQESKKPPVVETDEETANEQFHATGTKQTWQVPNSTKGRNKPKKMNKDFEETFVQYKPNPNHQQMKTTLMSESDSRNNTNRIGEKIHTRDRESDVSIKSYEKDRFMAEQLNRASYQQFLAEANSLMVRHQDMINNMSPMTKIRIQAQHHSTLNSGSSYWNTSKKKPAPIKQFLLGDF